MDVTSNFETLADEEFIVETLVVFAAFLAPTVLQSVAEMVLPSSYINRIPDELYGVALVVVVEMADAPYKRQIQTGGGLYTTDKLAERAGVKQTVQEAI